MRSVFCKQKQTLKKMVFYRLALDVYLLLSNQFLSVIIKTIPSVINHKKKISCVDILWLPVSR